MLYGTAFLAPSPYQAYSHYGSFYSTDGGKTFASSYWHLPNPDLKPQQKRTVEVNVLQTLGSDFQVSGSVFYSRFSNLIQTADADQSYAGLYHGWPVDYIDFAVNEGHAVDLRRLARSRLPAHVRSRTGASKPMPRRRWPTGASGTKDEIDVSAADRRDGAGPAPVRRRYRLGPLARRAAALGRRHAAAAGHDDGSGSLERRTLPGYATVDVNVRRNLFRTLDAFLTIENALDRRYRTINPRAYTNPEELIGAPQNPAGVRRIQPAAPIGHDVKRAIHVWLVLPSTHLRRSPCLTLVVSIILERLHDIGEGAQQRHVELLRAALIEQQLKAFDVDVFFGRQEIHESTQDDPVEGRIEGERQCVARQPLRGKLGREIGRHHTHAFRLSH